MENPDFTGLGLHPNILLKIADKGHLRPTAVQAQAIPHLLSGLDLLGIAQTGTGKTAAFSLPLLHRMALQPVTLQAKQVRSLILTPTRELAMQVKKQLVDYGESFEFNIQVVIGGQRRDWQVESIASGAHIVIGTPGRVLDLIKTEEMLFDQLEYFILDEADMMLDMGFLADVETIHSKLPERKQTMLFSATMPVDIEQLAKKILHNPIKVEVTPESSTIEKISQSVYFVEEEHKLFLLSSILERKEVEKVLIFCKAKYGVALVVEHLQKTGVTVTEIHSNLGQAERERSLARFAQGLVQVLVATDIASRGLDIPQVSHVINFNMPEDATNYVHRIGRTARAGKDGVSMSLCGRVDLPLLRNVEKLIKKKITVVSEQPFHQDFEVPKAKKRRRR